LGLAATVAVAPDAPRLSGFPFSVPSHSLAPRKRAEFRGAARSRKPSVHHQGIDITMDGVLKRFRNTANDLEA